MLLRIAFAGLRELNLQNLTLVEVVEEFVLGLVLQGKQGVRGERLVLQIEPITRWVSAFNFLHTLQVFIPSLLCIVIGWNCSAVVMIVDRTGRVTVRLPTHWQISVAVRLDALVGGDGLVEDASVR